MKAIRLLILILVVGGAWFAFWRQDTTREEIQLLSPQAITSPSPVARGGEPRSIKIPKMEVDTTVEPVGMAEDGRMAVPSSAFTTSWWKFGARPGEMGSIVLAGHLDTPQGEPGVFYGLGSLGPGDEIMIEDSTGKIFNYVVTSQVTYDDAEFPIEEVFADTSARWLRLITCEGTYDPTARNYSKRLVVNSQLKER